MHRSAWIILAWGGLAAVGACQVISGGDGFTFGTGGGSTGPGGGAAPECGAPEDCPGPATTCRYRICDQGRCDVENAVATTACSEDGGTRCDGAGHCVECLSKGDCVAETEDCQGFLCVPTHCFDDARSGNETGLDCGGDCAPCPECGGCSGPDDCASGVCVEGDGCGGAGGSGGTPSAGGGGAGGAGSTTKACVPCVDHLECQEGKYCDDARGVCVPTLEQGLACSDDAMCESGFCTDGVCCEAACSTECYGCASAVTGETSGLCRPIVSPSSDTGCTGLCGCNGSGSCVVLQTGLPC